MKNKSTISFVGMITIFSFLNYVLFVPTVAYADEEIATVEKGETVPFDGTLFSTAASAKILVELENNKEACLIECNKVTEQKIAELQFFGLKKNARFDSKNYGNCFENLK